MTEKDITDICAKIEDSWPETISYESGKTYRDLPVDAMLLYDLHLIDLADKWDADMHRRTGDGAHSLQAPQDDR